MQVIPYFSKDFTNSLVSSIKVLYLCIENTIDL